jgi:hypothetical protein
MIIIPKPSERNLYYLFSLGEIGGSIPAGIFLSVIDISHNAGLGEVIQKNVQLQSFQSLDAIAAIRHGNGRDWWLVVKNYDTQDANFFIYLITPDSVTYNIQSIGDTNIAGFGNFSFSKDGSRFLFTNYAGMIEVFDFNRCTGTLSNPQIIERNQLDSIPRYWGSAFSPDGRFMYVSTSDILSRLYQFDLSATDIPASKTLIDTFPNPPYPPVCGGALRLAPDDKIYMSNAYVDSVYGNYPYQDFMRNLYNENLSVINSPDSPGLACNFTKYSFYLGGRRSYWGLPNNPDYDMGAWVGSACDTIDGIKEIATSNPELFIFYHHDWQTAFINAKDLKGKNYSLSVYDLTGREVYKEEGTASSYYTKDLNCATFASGMYIVTLQTEREKLVKRFVKE